MKFKVGDYVKGIGYLYPVTNADMTKGIVDKVYTDSMLIKVLEHKDKDFIGNVYIVMDKLFELVEDKTEFTFQEVIARIKPGEVYECTRGDARLLKIHCEKGWIELEGRPTSSGSFGIWADDDTFKLVETKKAHIIYEVEHKEGGKRYSFSSNEHLSLGDFVLCDTQYGNTYGRIVSFDTKELTEVEYKEYKKCWRAK